MKALAISGALTFVLALPLVSNAALYNYVDSNGSVGIVTADTWTLALTTASDIHPRSGVALVESADGVGGTLDGVVLPDRETYQYVNTSGEIESTEAASPAEAFTQANDIALHSGVMLAEDDPIPEDTEVEL